MTSPWPLHARHILDCIAKIRRIQQRGDLLRDDILYDATVRNLQTLSESTQHLPDDLKARFPAIPWQQISGLRNILVHAYLGKIDPLTIQRVIDEHLAPLEAAVQAILTAADE